LDGVRKSYRRALAVAGVDVSVHAGEFFTLLGQSGSGKTTARPTRRARYGPGVRLAWVPRHTYVFDHQRARRESAAGARDSRET
jgi:alpha-D-ribose 1-methylphosphonate 5-triphosphate synthase subunit PhnL